MLRFIVRRVLITIPTILVVISITWGLIKLAPGNFYSGEKAISPAIEQAIREKYGLDKPWYKQNSKWDYGSMALAMLGISVPNFVLGPILVLIFSLGLYWVPPARWAGFPSRNLILPVLTLSAIYMAYIARLTRAGMLEVLRSDYIRTARAKGLSERDVLVRHALRGGLMPVISYTGPALAFLLTGTVVVERIFALPGLGNYFIQASLNRDEPLIIGIVAFIALALLLMNLLVDIAYAYLDPRVRYQ